MSAVPLSFRLRPSPLLAFLLLSGHALALIALAVSLEGLPLVLAAAGVALSAALAAADAMQRRADSPAEVELKADGRAAAWRDRQGRWHAGEVGRGGYVSNWLVLLPLTGPWGRKWIVVAPDSASSEERRRLRVWLRWPPGKPDAAGE